MAKVYLINTSVDIVKSDLLELRNNPKEFKKLCESLAYLNSDLAAHWDNLNDFGNEINEDGIMLSCVVCFM